MSALSAADDGRRLAEAQELLRQSQAEAERLRHQLDSAQRLSLIHI